MRNKGNKNGESKSLEDYEFYIGSSKQASDFEVTTKFIINHTQETFDSGKDIAEALRMMNGQNTSKWKPTLSVSTSEDEHVRDRENREFELDYKGESADYRDRVRECEKDLDKARMLTWGRCQMTLRDRIEAQTGFEASIRNNPIELLLAIELHA